MLAQAEHSVARELISKQALSVLERLHKAGFAAYLVGGGVRDILCGLKPKDFDIATDASPEQARELFRRSRIIGRRFRLVHVIFGREIIEVATFRASHDEGAGGEIGEAGRILRDNVFGTIEQDAARRDFSVNALYYNFADNTVVDFVGGLQDIEKGMFRLIGDPMVRCEEDPVRIIRAARLSGKLGFAIEHATEVAMDQCAPLLETTPAPRMFEEVLKLFQGGYALKSFERLLDYDLLEFLFPSTAESLRQDDGSLARMLQAALTNTDSRVAEGKPVTPAYLLAFFLWHDIHKRAMALINKNMSVNEALYESIDQVLPGQLRVTSIPKRFSGPMREIWFMQPRLEQLTGKKALVLLEHRRFRAAYDFLCLRSTVDKRLVDCAAWWTEVQEVDPERQQEMAAEKLAVNGDWRLEKPKSSRKRRGRRKPRPKSG